MSEPKSRRWQIFLQVFEALPRQGPGNAACARRALELCAGLPEAPDVLDLGCGVGGQTLQLANLLSGTVVAVDRHGPFIEQLTRNIANRGLTHRVQAIVGDIASLPFAPASFDLTWSEGALYQIGLELALSICRTLLRPRGHLAFTDAVWRRNDPPAEVRDLFADYPTMGHTVDVIERMRSSGFDLLGHFPLPSEAWWDDFYTPMLRQIERLRVEYANDRHAMTALDEIGLEPELHRRFGDCYGYEFFVARRRD